MAVLTLLQFASEYTQTATLGLAPLDFIEGWEGQHYFSPNALLEVLKTEKSELK